MMGLSSVRKRAVIQEDLNSETGSETLHLLHLYLFVTSHF